MKKPKIKVLYLYNIKSPNEVDFIFEDGGFCYTWLDEKGFVTVMHYTERMDEETDLNNIIDELQGSKAHLYHWNGEEEVKKRKIDKQVLQEVLTWHNFNTTDIKDFELIKIERSENDSNHIKAFLKLFGGFNFNKKEVSCNENK